MFELNNFDSMQVGLASPEKIREWSYGEVTKPETINYRTQKPERDGLFCERIFGPTKDWECHCGKYKRIRYKGVICDKCGVEVTRAKVRRERMGHIELVTPVSHIWYFKGVPSRIGTLLNISIKKLEQVLYFTSFIVTDPGTTEFEYKQVLNDREYREALEKYGPKAFKAGMGAEVIKELLSQIDLEKESAELKVILKNSKGQKKLNTAKRLGLVDAFIKTGARPEWMILDVLPVIPPELRPMVPLDGGRFATSDLNDLYRRVINRNNRLKKLVELGAPEIICRNEKRMLQEAVDALIDNGRRGKAISGAGNRELKSLSGLLRGKQGRFRQNLLGKRVDYSGRSVIVVGPSLKMYQCGLPKEMALELFKPFIMKRLVDLNQSHNIKSAKHIVERARPVVWDVLEDVIKDHPVLLNRAPTLHRLSIQAFEPVLVEGGAMKLHPLTCAAFNADFDGDQMAVHVPLSIDAQTEARYLMIASNNILKLSDGEPISVPYQDMLYGIYYLTVELAGEKGEGRVFADYDEAVMAYQTGSVSLHSKVWVRVQKEIDGKVYSGRINTTVGRMIFNQVIPEGIGIIKRETPEDMLQNEVEFAVSKKMMKKIIKACYVNLGSTKTAIMLDKIKELGYEYSTKASLTANLFDIRVAKDRLEIIADADAASTVVEKQFKRGLITKDEKSGKLLDLWSNARMKITTQTMEAYEHNNPLKLMVDSGARGSKDNMCDLSGIRGLMMSTSGKVIEVPIRASFREGLSVIEYFIATRGGRKGMVDKALKTADAGYLTRRLVDVAQEVIVDQEDCFAALGEKVKGMKISAIYDEDSMVENIAARIVGRCAAEDIIDPTTNEVLVKTNEMISKEKAEKIEAVGIKSVNIRTVFTCKSKYGVCSKCYGRDMSCRDEVKVGEAVGVIAAQSIGELGTQLTMNVFHGGGTATQDDITAGLPRVEEIFEAKKPKGVAVISEISGKVTKIDEPKQQVTVLSDDGSEVVYGVPYGARFKVAVGSELEPGARITEGPINPHDILKTRGVKDTQDYMIVEVLKVYHKSGVDVNDKHLEIIIRQMLRKVRIEDAGDTSMLPGDYVDMFKFEEENERVLANGGEPATAKRVLLSITKSSLATDSFLSAASFQETVRVLTDAAIKGSVDNLVGLKDNIIIGKRIPAGTGLKRYRDVTPTEVTAYEPELDDNASVEENA
ncbi:MAG: DNA-directed RNA polymerase subunit beta' [Clostridia bacterium]|nr:DNA-directed RNA polymerase subunit beta' [Clostridia bacterium]